jgi:hypothetical protein
VSGTQGSVGVRFRSWESGGYVSPSVHCFARSLAFRIWRIPCGGDLNQLLLTMAIIALIVHFVHSVRRRRARFDNRRREEEKQHDYSS